ncbi:MAG: DUF3097 domain-containing protein [Microbacteriaceae bacterium]|nr:DUF3097 domain-containing protein [Microbacteriaceae bacterium]
MGDDRYSSDVLAQFSRRAPRVAAATVAADRDLVVEHAGTGFCGAVVRLDGRMVELEDFGGAVRLFALGSGFLIDGEPITLVAPVRRATGLARSASGSVVVANLTARTARASRIFVEGRHDAELVEKVWGHDLRVDGVVVEYLEGVDDLAAEIARFQPTATRRVGVLVDHLVAGSKESRVANAVARGPFGAHVLVVGHPFVDVWQAVKPGRLGMIGWPTIPRSIEWKHGICAALGWPHEDQADISRAWQKILAQVRSFNDLEPVLLGRVEQLIDFVTAEE